MRRLLVLLLLTACHPSVPVITPDPGCEIACSHLTKLGCPEGGKDCVSFCSEYQRAGIDQNTGCLARVSSCDDTAECSLQ